MGLTVLFSLSSTITTKVVRFINVNLSMDYLRDPSGNMEKNRGGKKNLTEIYIVFTHFNYTILISLFLLQRLPGQICIPVPADGGLSCLLLVACGDASSGLLGQGLHRGAHAHYEPRLGPLVGLPQGSGRLLCDHFTAPTLGRLKNKQATEGD